MSTPAYGLKHWWRAERKPGESLKAFARRWAGESYRRGEVKTTAAKWIERKKGRQHERTQPR